MILRKVLLSFEEYTGNPRETKKKRWIGIRSVESHSLRSGMTSVYAQRSWKQVKRMLKSALGTAGYFLTSISPLSNEKPWGRKPDLQLKFFFKAVLLSQFEEQLRQWRVGANDISTRFFLTLLYFYRRFLHYFYTSVGKLISWLVLFSNPWTPRKAELQLNASSSIHYYSKFRVSFS